MVENTAVRFVDTNGASAYLGALGVDVKPRTLEAYRISGLGPRFRRLGGTQRGKVYYATSDLLDWVEAAVRTSTADPGPSTSRRGRSRAA